jgi:hypothetical protein
MNNPFGNPEQEDEDIFAIDGLDDVESKFKIPEGYYVAKVIDIEKQTSQAGNPMWVWTFTTTKGQYQGTELKVWTALTQAALWKLMEVLKALGIKPEKGSINLKKDEIIGRSCYINVVDREYQGRVTSSIASCEELDKRSDANDDTPF